MDNEKEITHIDLFSGIGGFTLAGEWAGFKTVAFCEKERFCQKILKKHWPEVPIIEEIRNFDGTKWRGATLLTGGFPCQPFSVAGQRRGKEDDRYLWPEMLRVIEEARPRWILAENVTGIVKLALGEVLSDLEGIGYDFPRDHKGIPIVPIIPACGYNAPHRRYRIWIIAYSKCERPIPSEYSNRTRPKKGLSQGKNSHAADSTRGRQFECLSEREKKNNSRESDKYASNSSNQGLQGCKCSETFQERQKKSHGSIIKCDRSSAWQEDWYEVAARFCRVDDGIPDRIQRLKALGNAIVPQIAYEILKNIAWIEKNVYVN